MKNIQLMTFGGALLPEGMTTQIVKKNRKSMVELIPITADTKARVNMSLESDNNQRRLEKMFLAGKLGVVKHIGPSNIRYIQEK